MIEIYSNIEPDKLLHVILNKKDVQSERTNIVQDKEFLQLAAMKLPKGKTFRPHKHLYCEKVTTITQESWLVIQGKAKVILYDLDDEIISEAILHAGDCSTTLYGAHSCEILEDDTIIYEYKTGPYLGQQFDREFNE